MLSIRKLTSQDKPRITEICKDIWEGDDYLPLVFDKWLNDPDGEFIAAIADEQIVGFVKLSMFSKHDAWIEGLRKDQHTPIRGVGKFLNEYLLGKLSNNPEIKTIRFCTYFGNAESIALYTKLGFRVLEKRHHKSYKLPRLKQIPVYKHNRATIINDEKAILDYFYKSKSAKHLNNGICINWVVPPVSELLISRDFIQTGHCIGIWEAERLVALALYAVREIDELFISFFEADTPKLADELLQQVKKRAYSHQQEFISTIIPAANQQNYDFFTKHNFKSWEQDEDVLIFEYPLNLLKK